MARLNELADLFTQASQEAQAAFGRRNGRDCLTGGAPAARHSHGGTIPRDHPRVALMPFENLSGREDQSEVFTRIFFAQLVATGRAWRARPRTDVGPAPEHAGHRLWSAARGFFGLPV